MPKYSEDKIFNHYLYFTSHCTIEAMHVHAGNEEMSEDLSAKFFVRAWWEIHKDELQANWDLIQNGEMHFKINPLQ